jgi:hypothetical protein
LGMVGDARPGVPSMRISLVAHARDFDAQGVPKIWVIT